MEVILKDDVPNLGEMGDIVEVADGYGRNYLIPQGLATQATAGRKAQIRHKQEQIEREKEEQREAAREVLEDLDGISISVPSRVAESDRLYGSVTSRDVADVLNDQGFEVAYRDVMMDEPFRELGIYKVPIKLASGINAHVRVWVVAM